jgi:hypothetical protein
MKKRNWEFIKYHGNILQRYIPKNQFFTTMKLIRDREAGEFYCDCLRGVSEAIRACPKMYETEKTPLREKTIYLHYFGGAYDLYVAEIDDDGKEITAFGLVKLHEKEWGYTSIDELNKVPFLSLDYHFTPTPISEIRGAL